MSAYIVDENHIAYLVQAGARQMRHSLNWAWGAAGEEQGETLPHGNAEVAQRVGQMLWDENRVSVLHRYPDNKPDELPGPIDCDCYFHLDQPVFRYFDPMQVFMSCDCYQYQSCEHDGWETSEARAFIDALRNRTWSSLPGYDDAIWGAPKPDSAHVATIGGAV